MVSNTLLSGRSLCCSSLSSRSSFLCGSFLASLACALRFSVSGSLSLLSGSFLVSLFSLALLQTLSYSVAASCQHYIDRILGVVVCRDNVVDILRVRVCINHCEDRNTQTVGLSYSDVLLHYVNNEECARQTSKV